MYPMLRYHTPQGIEPVTQWLDSLPDPDTRRAVLSRMAAVPALPPTPEGDGSPVVPVVLEALLDCGPGVRLYYAPLKSGLLLLLCGADPRTRPMERDTAGRFLEDYLTRTALAA